MTDGVAEGVAVEMEETTQSYHKQEDLIRSFLPTMAATFPLLNLSSAVSEHVLQFMKFPDLFDLSQCSKRTFNLVKDTFKNTPSALTITIDTTQSIRLTNWPATHFGDLEWNFYDARSPLKVDLEDPTTYNIDGLLMKFCQTGFPGYPDFDCASDHSIREFIKFCEHLMNLFNATIYKLDIAGRMIKHLKELQSAEAFRTSGFVTFDEWKVSHENLRQILTGFNAERLSLSSYTKPNFILDEMVTLDMIEVYSESWVNSQSIRNLDFKQGYFHDVPLTNETLHSVVKHWMEGPNTRMEFLCVSVPLPRFDDEPRPQQPRWEIAKIVEGIETMPGAAKRPDVTRYRGLRNQLPYAEGLDLKRESDGMIATVVLFTDAINNENFLFEVWQVPDPNVVIDDE